MRDGFPTRTRRCRLTEEAHSDISVEASFELHLL
jgi:hypothetical protein